MDTSKVPEEFQKIVRDFYKDILLVFPEYKINLDEETIDFLQKKNEGSELFKYCSEVYPERFFDILYQNEEIFTDSSYNTCFLPNIDFKNIWKENISEKTRKTIWKYLQLVLFSVSNELESHESFGDTAKLFEAIDEDQLKKKLEETMEEMNNMFKDVSMNNFFSGISGEDVPNDISNIELGDLPNPEDLQNHINGLLEGKLGRLAHEIAQETAEDLQVDMNEASSVGDVFQKLFKNPGRLIGMVKNVGKKLDEKIKSGEIKESELMKEASELMEKMQSMPGMKNMDNILSKMGLPVGAKGGKVNMNAFQSHMKRNIKKATQRERMLRKLEENRKLRAETQQYNVQSWGENSNVKKTTRKEAEKRKGKKKRRRNRKKNKN